ncbi:Rho GTPase [Tieghemostelium lacteum]|uniref:Rho GTPase n=1 Tax=Tieghemostelium lacteum TaxID=361077 RepID=A0A151Z651_TIELA|nr:Rho GTPase [Tieghemostelium lacteum]|eukprot:KYQ89436.1 Rho GTPase [Tieghemostelium lacteum]
MVILGEDGIGKTALLITMGDKMYPEYVPSVVGFGPKESTLTNLKRKYRVQFWDTNGSEPYDTLRLTVYRDIGLAILCFAIDSKYSFEKIDTKYYTEFKVNTVGYVPFILVGTKGELRSDSTIDVNTLVTRKQAEEYANKIGTHYVEVSSKNLTNIDNLFDQVVLTYDKSLKEKKNCLIQ